MKILQVHEIANVAATLAEGLRLSGHEVALKHLTLRGPKGPNLYTLPRILFLPERFRELIWVSNYIRSSDYDVVHIHYAYLGWIGILSGKPYFLHCHGEDVSKNLRRPIVGALTRRAIRDATGVFFSTPDLAEYVHTTRSDAVYVPNPVNTQAFKPDSRRRTGDEPRILFISGVSSTYKGGETQAEIIRLLKRSHPSADVTVLGSTAMPSDPSLIQDLSSLGITFTPRVPRIPYERMPSFINQYDIIVGQLGVGAMGMSELEAMACEKPVLAFFKYGDWYPEPPPIYSTRDPGTGVECLLELIKKPELRLELGRKAREWILEYHDYSKIAHRIEGSYQALDGLANKRT